MEAPTDKHGHEIKPKIIKNVPKDTDEKRLIVILDKASLESVKVINPVKFLG